MWEPSTIVAGRQSRLCDVASDLSQSQFEYVPNAMGLI